jgi:hypothetical protein
MEEIIARIYGEQSREEQVEAQVVEEAEQQSMV